MRFHIVSKRETPERSCPQETGIVQLNRQFVSPQTMRGWLLPKSSSTKSTTSTDHARETTAQIHRPCTCDHCADPQSYRANLQAYLYHCSSDPQALPVRLQGNPQVLRELPQDIFMSLLRKATGPGCATIDSHIHLAKMLKTFHPFLKQEVLDCN